MHDETAENMLSMAKRMRKGNTRETVYSVTDEATDMLEAMAYKRVHDAEAKNLENAGWRIAANDLNLIRN